MAPSPSPSGLGNHPSAASSPSASQLSLQLRQDLAKLAHKDPDTRRSSMESLKGFIEGELDARSMPGFLEQVSGETNKSSGAYAISLYVEVARVHRQLTIPFIPRIMASVLRCLASSSGGAGHSNNLHQACAKVVSAVARYAIEPASSTVGSPSSTDVLDSLCQPLLGLLCSNVEPVAVGSATCLQAIVEAENWKLAAPELVHDVCCRSSISLGEKGKQTVAHMHLVCSLAKFNPGILQEYGASLLRVAVHVLGNIPACGSWQPRVAAAQLLRTLLGCLDPRVLALELVPTMEALDRCRLDKVTMVRQAVGEALTVAKSLASHINPLLLGEDVSTSASSPACNRSPDTRKRTGRKKSGWRTEESCGSTQTADADGLGSQESHMLSHASSPSCSITSVSAASLGSPAPSTANSAAKIGRSPLYPAKQSPVFPPSSIDQYMSESELPYILAHMKSSDFKENTPLVGKSGESLMSSKSDELSYVVYGNGHKVTKETDEGEGTISILHDHDHTCRKEFKREGFLAEECAEADGIEADSGSERHMDTDDWARVPNCERKGCRNSQLSPPNLDFELTGFGQEQRFDLAGKSGKLSQEQVNQQGVARRQVSKNCMSAQDFLIFSTPRRLVRSLQSRSSTPDSKGSPERDQVLDMDFETLSESGWSVRDNPIAGDSEEDSPRKASIPDSKNTLTKSTDGPFSCCEDSLATQIDKEKVVNFLGSDGFNSASEASSSSHSPRDGLNVHMDTFEDLNEKLWKGGALRCYSIDHASPKTDSGQVDLPKKKQTFHMRALGKSSKNWTSRVRTMHFLAETLLFWALLVVLAFTAFIGVLNCIKRHHDLHMLVPT